MDELLAARQNAPGCRRVHGLTAITIRHLAGDNQAAEAVDAAGLAWSDVPGELTGNNPWLVWRSPQEKIALGFEAEQLNALRAALSPGQCDLAMAADVSDALAVFELHGPRLDEWLAHLVDAAAIPREPARCSRCRLADVPVLLLRLEPKRLWMVVDHTVRGYVENWLAFSHDGAFGSTAHLDS
jgi:hypothetical protein